MLATGGGPGARPGLAAPPPDMVIIVAGLLLELLIVAGMVHDWRARGRPSRVWVAGAAIITASLFLRPPISHSSLWLGFAAWTTHIAD